MREGVVDRIGSLDSGGRGAVPGRGDRGEGRRTLGSVLASRVRQQGKKELAREVSEQADFWQHAKTSAAPLAKVTDAQFTTKAVPADKASFGDQSAQFQLDRDSFEVVRLKGRWYIVDSGI